MTLSIYSITCPNHLDVIEITNATWGNSGCGYADVADSTLVTQAKYAIETTCCTITFIEISHTSFSCDGNSYCKLEDYVNKYGDPCPNIDKTMTVEYACVKGDH